MKLPRFRIAWMMAFVALVAINLWAIRALSNLQFRAYFVGPLLRSQVIGILILGGLPMAHVLASGLLLGRRRGSHPFLLGFEAFGATALALYIAGVSLFTEELVRPFLRMVLKQLLEPIRYRPYLNILGFPYLIMIATLILPQLAFALIGGFLSRQLKPTTRPN